MKRLQPKSSLIRHKSARFRLRIGRSRIHRYGVFVLEDIPLGREVIEYTGRGLTLDQAALLKAPHGDYLVGLSRREMIDGGVGGSGAQFINHSCNPNLTWQRRKGRLFFYSRKAIRAGEELTMYFNHPTKTRPVPCVCGARNCRKVLRYVVGSSLHGSTPDRGMKKQQRMALPRIKSKFARYRLRAGYSRIHRFGVYAMEEIPANRTVIEYTGKIRAWGESSRIPPQKHIYMANLKRGLVVDGRVGGSGAQYVNHSCAPNLRPERVKGHLFLVSRRRIRAGEELTLHYHYPVKLRRVPCRCGAPNCRRTFRVILTR